jgi:hypothetical protein
MAGGRSESAGFISNVRSGRVSPWVASDIVECQDARVHRVLNTIAFGHSSFYRCLTLWHRILDLDQLGSSAAGCFTTGTCNPIAWREIAVPGPRPQSSFGYSTLNIEHLLTTHILWRPRPISPKRVGRVCSTDLGVWGGFLAPESKCSENPAPADIDRKDALAHYVHCIATLNT